MKEKNPCGYEFTKKASRKCPFYNPAHCRRTGRKLIGRKLLSTNKPIKAVIKTRRKFGKFGGKIRISSS